MKNVRSRAGSAIRGFKPSLALCAAAMLVLLALLMAIVLGSDDRTVARTQAIASALAATAAAVLVILTTLYVRATRDMVREMEKSRAADDAARAGEAERAKEANDAGARRILRAALIEQTDNCRILLGSDPSKGSAAAATTAHWEPAFVELLDWLKATDLPADFAAYLAWLVGSARHMHGLFREECRLASMEVAPHNVLLRETQASDRWAGELEEVQVIAELLIGHSSAAPGVGEVHRQFVDHPWTVPQVGPTSTNDWRAALHLQPLEMVAPPPFPIGAAYGFAHHSRRGERARPS